MVAAFQAAWSVVARSAEFADPVRDGLIAAVRIGNDTDTVAAITGGLLGASFGASAIPLEWVEVLHGWPGYRAADLERLVVSALATT